MQSVIKWSIRIFWAMIGFYGMAGLVGILSSLGFGHFPPVPTSGTSWLVSWSCFLGMTVLTCLALSFLAMICLALLYSAYLAWFRLSREIVHLTVVLVSTVMFFCALHGEHEFLQPVIERGSRSFSFSFLPLLGLLYLPLIIFGAVRFSKAARLALLRVLFPITKTEIAV